MCTIHFYVRMSYQHLLSAAHNTNALDIHAQTYTLHYTGTIAANINVVTNKNTTHINNTYGQTETDRQTD